MTICRLKTHFIAMARNNRWANHRLYSAITNLLPGEFAASRTGFFPSIRETANHILLVDRFYLNALQEGGNGWALRTAFEPFADPLSLADAQKAQDEALIAYCMDMEQADPDRIVMTDRGPYGIRPEHIGNLLAHLFQHQIHHRGQIHAMLAGTSATPPQLDEFFLDFDRDPEIARLGLA